MKNKDKRLESARTVSMAEIVRSGGFGGEK